MRPSARDATSPAILDPSVIGSHVLVRTQQQNTDTIKQARFTATWEQDELKFDAGTSYLDDNVHAAEQQHLHQQLLAGVLGLRRAFGTHLRPGRAAQSLSRHHRHFRLHSWLLGRGVAAAACSCTTRARCTPTCKGSVTRDAAEQSGFNYPGPNPNPTGATPTLANSLARCARRNHPALCDYDGSLDLALDPGSVQDIEEKTWSLFVRAGFETDVADMPFHFSAGVRNERTECLLLRCRSLADRC